MEKPNENGMGIVGNKMNCNKSQHTKHKNERRREGETERAKENTMTTKNLNEIIEKPFHIK